MRKNGMTEYVEKAKAGDNKAMEYLYMNTVDGIYRYIYSSLNEKHLADDIVSNTYKKVIENIGSFRGDSSFKTWVFSIARNEMYRYFRSKKKDIENTTPILEEATAVEIDESTMSEEEEEKRDSESKKEVEWLLGKLPERYAEVLKIRYISNFTLDECAEYLDITKNNVKVLLNRAKKKANNLLTKKYEQD